jgi:tRNA modification GTPase
MNQALPLPDTIFALATAPGRAGIAVLRLSGPAARPSAEALAGPLPDHGRSLRILRDPAGEPLDQALVLTFAPGRSFTGEAVAELHVHGSPAVTAALLRTLRDQPNLRPAEAGEFTRRALENGRLDLAQVEGLADLIDAETDAQRRQAWRVFSGALGQRAEHWRARLLRAVALVEAVINFAEEDVPEDVFPEVLDLTATLSAELRTKPRGPAWPSACATGFEVAIVGPAERRQVHASQQVGGARRRHHLRDRRHHPRRDRGPHGPRGPAVTLLDTAGLREAQDPVRPSASSAPAPVPAGADLRVHLHLPATRARAGP